MKNQRILVIEDQQDVRENIVELLELSNYQVDAAPNGKVGVKRALEDAPDLILCDIMMPEMDGYEVLYLLSQNPETASVPFIFLTAKSEKEDFRKGMSMGADDYITKPFEEIELLGAIERRLKKYETLTSTTSIGELVDHATKYRKIEDLEKNRKTQTFKKKDTIYREGDFSNFVYKIIKGKIKTYHINDDGKEFIHDIKKEGDFLGELSIIQDAPRTEFAVALEDSELMLIPKEDFREFIFKNREVSGQFIKLLSNSLSKREKDLMEMAYNTVRKRTADALIKLYEAYLNDNIETPVVLDISRADLAGIVGTATESVIRVLSEFKKDKWVEIKGSSIVILEPEKIKSVRF